MRILSWNINGVRTVPQYHPWNTFKSWDGALEELGADIICFQEMKTTRAAIGRNFALPDSFNAFFSFPVSKSGYSGVAIYTNSSIALPLKAEEGISGRLQPKPPLGPEERVSSAYPVAHEMQLMPDIDGEAFSDFAGLDAEGRALVVDFGLFVLINLYCPNETSDARLPFKMNFHYLLEERVKKLISEGREVIVTGDINICSQPIDHCDGHLPSNAALFWEHPARIWLRDWIGPQGHMIDVTRRFWPERRGMYTCWNTKISARDSNYGTRIDYFLVTPGMLPWIKHSDIQPSIKGSDHCPVFIDLHDEITLESGEKLFLRQAMRMDEGRTEPPRLASKFWAELQGKQTLMSSFFTKPGVTPKESDSPVDSVEAPPVSESQSTPTVSQSSSLPSSQGLRPTTGTRKRVHQDLSTSTPPKAKKAKNGQATLASFFPKPSTASSANVEVIDVDEHATSQEEADHRLACEIAASQDTESLSSSQSGPSSSQSKEAWSSLFVPLQPPKCLVHGEAAQEFKVNKPGPNKGKIFFVCSRPVGPGYDRGRSERLRGEVNPQYKCDFFKWASDVKRDNLRKSKNG